MQTDFIRLKEILKQRDALIEDSGLVLYTDNENKKKNATPTANKQNATTANTDNSNEIKSILPAALIAPETAKVLDTLGEGTIDDKLRKLISDKQELTEINSKLLAEIDEERTKYNLLEKKLLNNVTKSQDNQDSTQDLHELQRMFCFCLFLCL